jgi:biopolymer transport protein ExbB
MLEYIYKGGDVMYPLLVMSLISMSVVIERGWAFWAHSKLDLRTMRAKVLDLVAQGRLSEAGNLCASTPSPVAAVMLVGIQAYDKHRHAETGVANLTLVSKSMDDFSVHCMGALERRFWILTTVGNSGPLLGMLGTVIGMIKSFASMSASSVNSDAVAGGISIALICTASGLVVALAAVIPYNFYAGKADDAMLHVEEAKSNLFEVLAERERQVASAGAKA